MLGTRCWVLGPGNWQLKTGNCYAADPHQHLAILINRDAFGFDELGFDALKELVGYSEPYFERLIRNAASGPQ